MTLFMTLILFEPSLFHLVCFYLRRSQQVNKWSNLRFLLLLLVVLLLVEKFLISGQ